MRPDLPTGTVTFLFTDVEGSTRLLHELGAEAYAEALAEHRRVIRGGVHGRGRRRGGHAGRRLLLRLPDRAGSARGCAGDHGALASGPIQVRVGLHTGTPLLTRGGLRRRRRPLRRSRRRLGPRRPGRPLRATAELVERLAHRPRRAPAQGHRAGGPHLPARRRLLPAAQDDLEHEPAAPGELVRRPRGRARGGALPSRGRRAPRHADRPRRHRQDAARASRPPATLVPEYKAGVFWVGLATLRDPALVTETIAQTLGAKDGLAEHIAEQGDAAPARQPRAGGRVRARPLERSSAPAPTSRSSSRAASSCASRARSSTPVPPLAEPEAVSLFCERAAARADRGDRRALRAVSTRSRSPSSSPPPARRRSRPSRSSSASRSGSTC